MYGDRYLDWDGTSVRTMFAPITVYTQPKCRGCERVKDQLDKAGVDYDVVDLTKYDEAKTYVTHVLKASSVPVIVTDTHEPIIGYQPDKVDELIDYYTASETGL
ncbi:glutaredoxin [Mycobacterium phage AN9]|nr:glutaredoxin [Mycobacterium phage ANI8]QJD52616.1 glutaredoxin [Mycobacterium phage AN9]BBC43617.1 putative glutaredoxin-like protein [Mycobacterium phage C3]